MMLRNLAASAAALAALTSAALAVAARAQPAPSALSSGPQVAVTIGQAFATKAQHIYVGRRDLDELSGELSKDVGRALARNPGRAPVRLDLVLEDAVNNRPTFDQLGQVTSLSYLGSIGLGGASIGGTATLADGSVVPVKFSWYETELRDEFGPSTWTDAERAFDLFAGRVARGDLRPFRIGSTSRGSGDFVHRFGDYN